jgi:hypothetical protein
MADAGGDRGTSPPRRRANNPSPRPAPNWPGFALHHHGRAGRLHRRRLQPLAAVITNSDAALRWLALEKPNYEEVWWRRCAGQPRRQPGRRGDRPDPEIPASRRNQAWEWIAVPKLLDELLLMLHTVLQDAGVQVVVRIAPDFPKIFADNVQLQQVILNLIVNAVDAMRERPGPRLLT